MCATRGEAGRRDVYADRTVEEFGSVREAELREAARALGVADVVVLGYPEGGVRAWESLAREALTGLLRTGAFDVIMTFGPDGISGHADHVAVSDVVTDVVREVFGGAGRDVHHGPHLYYVLRLAAVPPAALGRTCRLPRRGSQPSSKWHPLPIASFERSMRIAARSTRGRAGRHLTRTSGHRSVSIGSNRPGRTREQ